MSERNAPNDNAFALDRATGDGGPHTDPVSPEERAAAALARALIEPQPMPLALRDRLMKNAGAFSRGEPVGPRATPSAPEAPQPSIPIAARRPVLPWLAAAACLAIAGGVGYWAMTSLAGQGKELTDARMELAAMHERVQSNERLVTLAQAETAAMRQSVEDGKRLLAEREQALASLTGEKREIEARLIQSDRDLLDRRGELAVAMQRQTELVARLAAATSDLDNLSRELDQYTAPADPAVLAQNRTKLIDMPDTVRIAWSPFNLEGSPAVQQGVGGDVVWNDDLQQGYLRFVGLNPNDPNIEQYQVWIVDDRGMEQKVSGGVFNVSDAGEIIVPIKPGLDVRKVALFAITVERPGGIVVPDLQKRVVVAPVGGG